MPVISRMFSEESDPKTKLHLTAFLEIITSAANSLEHNNLDKNHLDIAKLQDNIESSAGSVSINDDTTADGATNNFHLVMERKMEGSSKTNSNALPIIKNPAVTPDIAKLPTGEKYDLETLKSEQGNKRNQSSRWNAAHDQLKFWCENRWRGKRNWIFRDRRPRWWHFPPGYGQGNGRH